MSTRLSKLRLPKILEYVKNISQPQSIIYTPQYTSLVAQKIYNKTWDKEHQSLRNGKLGLCTSIKESLCFENYLNLHDLKLWSAVTKMRISVSYL